MYIENRNSEYGPLRYAIVKGNVVETMQESTPQRTILSLDNVPFNLVYNGNHMQVSPGDNVVAAIPLFTARRSYNPLSRKIVIKPCSERELGGFEEVSVIRITHNDTLRGQSITFHSSVENPASVYERKIPSCVLQELVAKDLMEVESKEIRLD